MDVRYLVLGPVAVDRGGGVEIVSGRRAQALLASLVISANHVVPIDHLISAVWEDDWPESPHHAVQSLVSQLRRLVGPAIEGVDHGYRLGVECDRIDACAFEGAFRTAHSVEDPVVALDVIRSALGMWRGPPFGELADIEPFRLEAIRLEELRLAAHEFGLRLMLSAGRAEEAVAELKAAVRDHPLREGLWESLIRGLIDLKRRGEAIAAFDEYRATVSALGLPPDPALVHLIDRLFDSPVGS